MAIELIEAASRTGEIERAADALGWLSRTARAGASDWGLGVEARSRALLSHGESAERLYGEAIERLGRTPLRVDLARAHLLYGEWMRRGRRRRDARAQLRTAFEMFNAMGLDAFAGRAERELLATGERVGKRRAETRDELTTQEAQVARLARAQHHLTQPTRPGYCPAAATLRESRSPGILAVIRFLQTGLRRPAPPARRRVIRASRRRQ